MSNPVEEEPGTEEAAEAPLQDGYGNDTGFAQDAEEAEQVEETEQAEVTGQGQDRD